MSTRKPRGVEYTEGLIMATLLVFMLFIPIAGIVQALYTLAYPNKPHVEIKKSQ